jgi:broad specificity phosphatase PhoE
MGELIFVRHGQASFGAQSYDKLSPLGEEQVQLLAAHWRETGEHFDHLYSGALLRQRETAQILRPLVAEEAGSARIHTGFNEYDGTPLIDIYLRDHHPADEPLSLPIHDRTLFQRVFEGATARWIAGELTPTSRDSGFEHWRDFQARVHGAMDELMATHEDGERVLVSTSGGVIALALQRALALPDSQVIATNWMVNNSSVTRLRFGDGKVSLAQFNALAHLEKPGLRDKITFR